MGASYDHGIAVGKELYPAFIQLTNDRAYDYGHAGYTGTLAEKYEVTLVGDLPSRWTPDKFMLMAQRYEDWQTFGKWTEYLSYDRWIEHSAKPRMSAKAEAVVAKFVAQGSDKWGPAVAVEIKGAQLKHLRSANPFVKRGSRAWVVGGWCSS